MNYQVNSKVKDGEPNVEDRQQVENNDFKNVFFCEDNLVMVYSKRDSPSKQRFPRFLARLLIIIRFKSL